MPAIATACVVTSSTIWVSVIWVLRTEGICPYPTIATSIIRSPFLRAALTSASGSPVGIQPSMPPSVLLQPPAARSSSVALRLRAPHGGDPHPDAYVADRRVEHLLELQHPAGAVERDRHAGEGLGLLLAGVLPPA